MFEELDKEFEKLMTRLVKALAWFYWTMIVVVVVILGKEIARIYVAHGRRPPIAYILWGAAVSLALCWLLAAILNNSVSGYLFTWSLFAFIVIIEACDFSQRGGASAPPPGGGQSFGETVS